MHNSSRHSRKGKWRSTRTVRTQAWLQAANSSLPKLSSVPMGNAGGKWWGMRNTGKARWDRCWKEGVQKTEVDCQGACRGAPQANTLASLTLARTL
eukprot:1138702-Pelagomonas_calceolata.AAC.3